MMLWGFFSSFAANIAGVYNMILKFMCYHIVYLVMIKLPEYSLIVVVLLSSCSLPSRGGKKIYVDFFAEPPTDCVKVLESRDARALDDCCVWLHFKTCPKEAARILSQVHYTRIKMDKRSMDLEYPALSTADESIISSDPPKWWAIKQLGDSCIKYEYRHSGKDYIQIVYMSVDSSEVYYHDIAW
ncbi:hypothetical protein Q4E93_00760 [Flavitalea sp. BT771]|uniref:hypothetical protein n=1 Tax=Flavitalea sp. BT771 TaxID=3063329 RepID=UPI0026E20B5A|nr:hypothetical protein [Flavitalea sp. BT771]MDO6429095.1 hypothetical protein [Flavitalea sp. BT771]MDV6218777.1 hypothetical protein [Flavitalea sp. BT771]